MICPNLILNNISSTLKAYIKSSLNNCLKKYLCFYVKTPIMLANTKITTILECLQRHRCTYCLHLTNHFSSKYFPIGFVCSAHCEIHYMEKFIIPTNHSEHRCRALWIKHLGLCTMNNIGRVPNCKEHFTFKICILDSLDFDGIKT